MNDYMNDPRMKKLLQDLINRPESVSSMDVQPENTDEADAMKVASPEYQAPEDMVAPKGPESLAGAKVVPEMGMGENMKVQGAQEFQGDPEVTAMLRKLKAGQPAADEAEVVPENVDDTSMDEGLRKAALEKVKQKYLGR